jgi:FkbM family methyltransferase
MVNEFNFLSMVGLPNDRVSEYISRYRCYYEAELLELLVKILPPVGCVIDIGAHIGNHSCFFLNQSDLDVIAFEPNPVAFNALKRNVSLSNTPATRAQLHNVALGASPRKRLLQVMKDPGQSRLLPPDTEAAGPEFIETKVSTLDLEITDRSDIVFIKIDVEGTESDILAGAQELIKRTSPFISTEVINEDAAASVIEALISSHSPIGVLNSTPTILWAPNNYTLCHLSLATLNDICCETVMAAARRHASS